LLLVYDESYCFWFLKLSFSIILSMVLVTVCL
jgi:hypothetical protein